jgi:hypothetical protein
VESETVTMTEPPRVASWLIAATLLPDAEAIAGDLCEEMQQRSKWWYSWQVARSLAPLFFRSWQRASVTRASAAMIAAAAVATMPAAALLSLRSFALSQVPLKTTPDLSASFGALLLIVLLCSVTGGFLIGSRLLNSRT